MEDDDLKKELEEMMELAKEEMRPRFNPIQGEKPTASEEFKELVFVVKHIVGTSLPLKECLMEESDCFIKINANYGFVQLDFLPNNTVQMETRQNSCESLIEPLRFVAQSVDEHYWQSEDEQLHTTRDIAMCACSKLMTLNYSV